MHYSGHMHSSVNSYRTQEDGLKGQQGKAGVDE